MIDRQTIRRLPLAVELTRFGGNQVRAPAERSGTGSCGHQRPADETGRAGDDAPAGVTRRGRPDGRGLRHVRTRRRARRDPRGGDRAAASSSLPDTRSGVAKPYRTALGRGADAHLAEPIAAAAAGALGEQTANYPNFEDRISS
jgi:hypothetical protein